MLQGSLTGISNLILVLRESTKNVGFKSILLEGFPPLIFVNFKPAGAHRITGLKKPTNDTPP